MQEDRPRRLETGDQIEFCIKVYAAHREPEESTPYAISGTRVVEVMTFEKFNEWLTNVAKEDARVAELYRKQLESGNPK